MSNSGKVWDTREAYQKQRANTWQTPGNRGMRLGGQTTPSGTNSNTVEYVDMISTGNTADFGDLTQARKKGAGAGGFTRILCLGGQTPTNVNTIDFVNPTATGNFTDFGDLVNAGQTTNCSHSNNVKTISADGSGDDDGVVITHMASQGNSSTWQNRTAIDTQWASGTGDNTRFLMAGNYPASNQIDSMEIATLGAKADFGNLTRAGWGIATGSNSTRCVFMGGNVTPGTTNVIDFVTTQSAGNATDFGDLTASSFQDAAGASNSKRAIAFGYQVNTVDSINIATTGNATDFGDTLTSTFYQIMGADNGGGGLPQEGAFPQSASVNYMPGSGRGFVHGGTPGPTEVIQKIEISTAGAVSDFGNLTVATRDPSGCGTTTRIFCFGGASPSVTNTISSYSPLSEGNAADYGDLTVARTNPGGTCNRTRAIASGGTDPGESNVIDYFSTTSTGNATDFGDLTVARWANAGSASPTRAIFAGGSASPASTLYNIIDYVTIASTGDATDFGDLTVARAPSNASGNSETRNLVMGGADSPGYANTTDYSTIASTGNATDFGDLTAASAKAVGLSNNIRALHAAGQTGSANPTDAIDFFTIASTGNATDFGDAIRATKYCGGGSDNHGGLQSS
jgi:hypothetical protein